MDDYMRDTRSLKHTFLNAYDMPGTLPAKKSRSCPYGDLQFNGEADTNGLTM